MEWDYYQGTIKKMAEKLKASENNVERLTEDIKNGVMR